MTVLYNIFLIKRGDKPLDEFWSGPYKDVNEAYKDASNWNIDAGGRNVWEVREKK